MAKEKEKLLEKVDTLQKNYNALERKYELSDSIAVLYKDLFAIEEETAWAWREKWENEVQIRRRRNLRSGLIGGGIGAIGGLVLGLLVAK